MAQKNNTPKNCSVAEEVSFTFENVKGNKDVVIAKTIRDGKTYELSVIAIPEQDFDQHTNVDSNINGHLTLL